MFIYRLDDEMNLRGMLLVNLGSLAGLSKGGKFTA